MEPSPTACTVYIGRISTEVGDDFVRNLLEKCGKVSKWNRAADPNTSKLTSFGFCDFEDPQSLWRALHFLHERQLCDKRLLVKCEDRVKVHIDTWKAGRREDLKQRRNQRVASEKEKEKEKEKENKDDEKGDQDVDMQGKEDRDGKDDGKDSAAAKALDDVVDLGPLTDEQLEEELELESKDVSNEIQKLLTEKNKGFPEVKTDSGATDEKEKEKEEEKTAEDVKEKDQDKDVRKDDGDKKEVSEPTKEEKEREDAKRKDEEERRERSRERREREKRKEQAVSRHYRQSRRERDRESRVRDRERDIEKEYQYRIREFERNEDKRISAHKRELRDSEMVPEPSDREKRKFVERDTTYGQHESDEREWKRHREDRLRDRQKEKEKDAADRKEQEKEVEEERRKKEEEEKKKKKAEEEARKKAQKEAEEERRRQKEEERKRREEEQRKEQEELERRRDEEKKRKEAEDKKKQQAAAAKLLQSVQEEMQKKEVEKLPSRSGVAGVQAVGQLFRDSDETEVDEKGNPRKHKPLTRLDGTSAPSAGGDARLRDDDMRKLIQQVPTEKARAFAFVIDWDVVHANNIIEKKLRPWVKKKVTEYLGAEEQGMIEFIMRKVSSATPPETILAELEGFLDEEAENFTLKMWRMLIFEVLRVKAR